jgi:hypothetical protein
LQVELVDGIQNLLPANITSLTQNTFSPLLDAYKRSEVDPETGLANFALNSTLTDLAEPSESLLATTVMQLGLDQVDYLLSSVQLDNFRAGLGVTMETEVRVGGVPILCTPRLSLLRVQNAPGTWWQMSARIVLQSPKSYETCKATGQL